MDFHAIFSKDWIMELISQLNYYFSHLEPDEMYAWIAIIAGFLLFVIGLLLA